MTRIRVYESKTERYTRHYDLDLPDYVDPNDMTAVETWLAKECDEDEMEAAPGFGDWWGDRDDDGGPLIELDRIVVITDDHA